MYENETGNICIEKSDQCATCGHYKDVKCALLQALAMALVELVEDMTVENCPQYAKKERHLKAV